MRGPMLLGLLLLTACAAPGADPAAPLGPGEPDDIAWGTPVDGLQLGLRLPAARAAARTPIDIEVWLRATGPQALVYARRDVVLRFTSTVDTHWQTSNLRQYASQPWRRTEMLTAGRARPLVRSTLAPWEGWRFERPGPSGLYHLRTSDWLPPDRYWVRAHYSGSRATCRPAPTRPFERDVLHWEGEADSGDVELELTPPPR